MFFLFITLLLNAIALNCQMPDCLNADNSRLTIQESGFLNSYQLLFSESYDFTDKKVAFYYSDGFSQKQFFFNEANEYALINNTVSIQLITLSESEKEITKGFDAIIVAWCKFKINPKLREEIIKELIQIVKD
jgi:hypothetical protein